MKELPVDILFGKNGKQISQLIDYAKNIEEKNVHKLAELWTKGTSNLYSETWNRWFKNSSNPNYRNGLNHNTLKAFGTLNKLNSPVGEGLSLIVSQFDKRAVEVLGKKHGFSRITTKPV